MDCVRKDIEKLVEKELKNANEKFPLFQSAHEGYAVILEEVDEADLELFMLKDSKIVSMWNDIKNNRFCESVESAKRIKDYGINLAIEAIQIAAMGQKFIDSSYGWKDE